MDLIDWGSKPQPSSEFWWGFKLLWIASTLKYRQGSVLKQYSILSEVVGFDYLGFTSLHENPLRLAWKEQPCPLLITVLFLCSVVCSSFQLVTRSAQSLFLLSLAAAVMMTKPEIFSLEDDLAVPFAVQMKTCRSGRNGWEWERISFMKESDTSPQDLLCFPGYLLHHMSRPTQHTLQHHFGRYPFAFIIFGSGALGSDWVSGILGPQKSSFWLLWHLQQEFLNPEYSQLYCTEMSRRANGIQSSHTM